MEVVHNFRWFMQELTSRRVKFSMLEAIICSGDSTKARYMMDHFGIIKQIQENPIKLRYMLNSLLDVRSPILSEYNPKKLVCILCREKCITLLRAGRIINLSENRILSMKIKSIHVIPFDSPEVHIYELKAQRQPFSFKITKTLSSSKKELPFDLVQSKARELYSYIHDFLLKASTQELQSIQLHFLLDGTYNCYMLRVSRIKMHSPSETDPILLKKSPSEGFSLITNRGSSLDFIQILAKTVERERKAASKSFCGKIKALNMEDLLTGIETTRPKVWAKDLLAKKKPTRQSLCNLKPLIQGQVPLSRREVSWDRKIENFKTQINLFQVQAKNRSRHKTDK